MPKKRVKKGGALKANQLQQVLENTYKETDDAPDGYAIDKDLSDDRVKVYKDLNSDQVIVAYRGSKGWRDWLDNARYAYSGDITTSGTYQDAKKRQQKAVDKYGQQNIISVGHSRAGKYVEELNKEQPVKEVITYNKAVHPNTIFQSNPENQTDVRTSTDVVSALSPLQFSKNKTVTIPGGYDLLKTHKPSALSWLGQKLIGKGYKQMRVGDMRKFVKVYKKEKYGEKMTGGARLGKKELVDMIKPIMEDDDLDEMIGGSVWTDFVKEFSARHSLKYACSLSKYKEPLKKAYKLKKEGKDWYEPFKTTGEIGVGTYKPPYQPAAEPDDLPYQPPETKPESKPTIAPVLPNQPTQLKIRKIDQQDFRYLISKYPAPEEANMLLKKSVEELKQISDGLGLPPPQNLITYRYPWISGILGTKYPTWKDIFTKKYGLSDDELLKYYHEDKGKYKLLLIPLDQLREHAKKIGADTPPEWALDIREYLIYEILKKKQETKKEPEPEQDIPYKPKMTREMRFQMEKALRESTKHLPPLRSKREDALIAQQVPALKGILKGLKEKTTGLKRQDMIDLILKREGIVKGAVFDDYNDYKMLEEQYRIRENKGYGAHTSASLTGMRELVANLRDKLKKEEQEGKRREAVGTRELIDRYAEEVKKLERLSKMDQYLISKVKKGGMVGGNRWTDFVKEYATRDNTTYGCALSDAGTKNAYKLFKDGKPWYFPKAKEMETQTDEFVEPEPEPAPVNIEPVINRIEEKLKQLEEVGRKKGAVSYDSASIIADIAFVNLMRKYGGRCLLVNMNETTEIDVGIVVNTQPKRSLIYKDGVKEKIGETLKECVDRGVSLICIPLTLRFGASRSGHANLLVYRPFQRLVERFEPHGSQYGNSDKDNKSINDQLRTFWEEDLKPFIGDVRFRDPDDICPTKQGFQSLEGSLEGLKQEGGGFCSMWSHFFTELTFINPTKTSKEIITEALDITKRQPDYLKSVIRGYVLETETALDELLKTLGKPGFKFGKKSYETVYGIKDELQQWLLGAVFDSKKYSEAPPRFEPLPGVILKTKDDKEKQMDLYKQQLNMLTKEKLDTIYSLYGLKAPPGNKERLISVLIEWLDSGQLEKYGSIGLKDLDIIFDEELYLKKGNYLPGLAKQGYFKTYYNEEASV